MDKRNVMTNKDTERMNIEVDQVVFYGEEQRIGIVMEIRIIDSAKFVQKFTGSVEDVMVRIRTQLGTALIWPKRQEITKVSDHEAKEFKARLKREESA